jgi:hypothetical protein
MLVQFFAHCSRVCKGFGAILVQVCIKCANFGVGLHESVRILTLLQIRVQMFAVNANCRGNVSEYDVRNFALFWQIAHES